MDLTKITIPYVLGEKDRNRPFTEDLQLASLYILADGRRGSSPISAAVLAEYPFQLRRYDGGTLLIDLLGLNQTKIKYNKIPDVKGFVEALEKVSEDPLTLLKNLKKSSNHFKDFTGQETVTLKGLISKPVKAEEVKGLLEKTVDYSVDNGSVIFDAVLNDSEMKDLFGSLNTLKMSLTEDQKSLETAKQGMTESLDIAEKVLKEETLNISDSSDRVQTRLRDAMKKKETRLKKKLDRDIERIKKRYNKQTASLKEERTKRRRKIRRIEKKINRMSGQKNADALKNEKAMLMEAEKKHQEIDNAVKSLEKKRDDEINSMRSLLKSELKVDDDKIREEEEKKRSQIKEKDELLKSITKEAKGITGQIDALIRKKGSKLRSFSRLKMDLKTDEAELNIPFYIFQYGEKKFDYHPPVEITSSAGLFSRFRRMLADNPESKVSMLIRPSGLFIENYLDKAVKSLKRDNPVSRIYGKEAEGLNVFRSRQSVDLMMTGLVKMRKQGWISDSEYIKLQEAIVDKLGLINQP